MKIMRDNKYNACDAKNKYLALPYLNTWGKEAYY